MTERRRWFDPLTGAPGDSGAGAGTGGQGRPWQDSPTAVGEVAAGLAQRRDWHRRLEGSRIHHVWTQIAGEAVADHVRPVRLLGGVLVLEAESGGWASQVRYLIPSLIERANEALGDRLVEQIKIVTARPGGRARS